MKPMLERKRRARMNTCLTELKELMVGANSTDCESITKLEKADVLELTVTHLKKLQKADALAIHAVPQREVHFRNGFKQCVNEVARFVNLIPGIDMSVSKSLLGHLHSVISQFDSRSPSSVPVSKPSGYVQQPSVRLPQPVTVSIPHQVYCLKRFCERKFCDATETCYRKRRTSGMTSCWNNSIFWK